MTSDHETKNAGQPEFDETEIRIPRHEKAKEEIETNSVPNVETYSPSDSESVAARGDSNYITDETVLRTGDVTQPNSYESSVEILKAGEANGERYQLGNEIARGGMGAVIRGRDRLLGRELAIKVMLDQGKDDPSMVRRFVDEAQICGQLQHPGITPVHDIGTLENRHPFFAMKLIKGDTLAARLKNRRDPKSDLQGFLSIFESICQTIAFAHSKSVIHRDLKPANIMVGAFGEVQVMDWGLAKVLRAEEDSGTVDVSKESRINTVGTLEESTAGASEFTQDGSVMGTIAYMPPEQAAGNVDQLDTRADVFALGAILAEILTGNPIYIANDIASLHRMAMEGDLSSCFKRLEESECDSELLSLVRDCLCVNRADRLEDGSKVAKRVKQYEDSVADRLHQAELERVASAAKATEATKTAAAERGRRRLSLAISGLALLFVLVAAIGTVLVQQGRHRTKVAEDKVKLEKGKVELEKLRQAEEKRTRLDQVRRQLSDELAVGGSQLKQLDGEEIPTLLAIDQVIDAASRAAALLAKSEPTAASIARQKALADRAGQLREDFILTKGLEDCWASEIGGRFLNTNENLVYTSTSPEPISVSESSTDVAALHRVIDNWINQLSVPNNVTNLTQRLEQLPPWAKSTVISSLYRFVNAADQPSLARITRNNSWISPKAFKAESMGGATLAFQKDGSYLASGVNPPGDKYNLLFAMDESNWNGIQIEALPDPSNQNFLGRGRGGHAAIIQITVEVARAKDLSRIVQIPIVVSEANYCFSATPLRVGGWNLTFAGKEPKKFVGFLETSAEEALAAVESKEIPNESRSRDPIVARIRIQCNTSPKYNDQNLGRFRLSFGKVTKRAKIAETAELIRRTIQNIQLDPWQAQLCRAIETQDVSKMLDLAKDETAISQPAGYVIWLAETLFDLGEVYYAEKIDQESEWINSTPISMVATNGDLEFQNNQSIAAKIPSGANSYDIRYDRLAKETTPKIIRLETFGTKEGDQATDATEQRIGLIRELRIYLRFKDRGLFELRNITSTAANHIQTLRERINLAADRDKSTVWDVVHPRDTEKCVSIFKLDELNPASFLGQMIVQIDCGQFLFSSNSNIQNFRISWTTNSMPHIDDPRVVAYRLLQDMHLKSPSDFRLLLALSRNSVMKPIPDFNSAMEYATAAVAKRPENPVSSDSFVALTLLQDPVPGSDSYLRGVAIAKRFDDLAREENGMLKRLLDYNLRYAERAFSSGKKAAAAKSYEELYKLSPETFWGYDLWGLSLTNINRYGEAEKIFLEGVKKQPNYDYILIHYSHLLNKMGRYKEARQRLLEGLEINPKNGPGLERIAQVEMTLGKPDEACKYWKRFFDSHPSATFPRLCYGLALAETGQFEKSLEILGSNLEKDVIGKADFALTYCQILDHLDRGEDVIPTLQKFIDGNRFTLMDLLGAVMRRAIDQDATSQMPSGARVDYKVLAHESLVPIVEHCVSKAKGIEKQKCLEIQAIVALSCYDLEFAEQTIDELPNPGNSYFSSGGFIKAAALAKKGNTSKARELVEASEKIAAGSTRQETFLILDYLRDHPAFSEIVSQK